MRKRGKKRNSPFFVFILLSNYHFFKGPRIPQVEYSPTDLKHSKFNKNLKRHNLLAGSLIVANVLP